MVVVESAAQPTRAGADAAKVQRSAQRRQVPTPQSLQCDGRREEQAGLIHRSMRERCWAQPPNP